MFAEKTVLGRVCCQDQLPYAIPMNVLQYPLRITTIWTNSDWQYQNELEALYRLNIIRFKGTNPPLKKSLNIPEIYAKMFGRFH